jgi:hypothetical protein
MLEKLPKEFKNPYYIALVGFVLGETSGLVSALINGQVIDIGCGQYYVPQSNCYSLLPTTPWEWGQFIGRQLPFVGGALLWYWWEIGRKKDPEDDN